ncbi:hypothetical protein H2200_002808 [Cladophialophora chaetospira]|uniref:Uncharacterized protein n=1 Tax=Cladophialophora chaetospira TaxID=386627 RepID=A0AA38XGB5_9EURO|nr:hypothetical protein H2200_002808 [Cladophialophora chaetospira]
MAARTVTPDEIQAVQGLLLFSGRDCHDEQAVLTLMLVSSGKPSVEQEDVVADGSRSPSLNTVASSGSTESIVSGGSSRTTLEATTNDEMAVGGTADTSGGKGKGKEKHVGGNDNGNAVASVASGMDGRPPGKIRGDGFTMKLRVGRRPAIRLCEW